MNEESQLDVWSQHETVQPRHRLVLLGASNLARAFPTVVTLARSYFGGPVSIYSAHGLGRSYGLEAGNLGKKFPGIFFSGLWPALEREKSVPTFAWITDIGNDLAYEARVESILEWVSGCVERLTAIDSKIVIADLPLANLSAVSERKFRFFRALLFPRCRLSREEVLTRAAALSDGLHALGKSQKIPIFPAQIEWYGIDPIHPRRRHMAAIWQQLFNAHHGLTKEISLWDESWLERWYLELLEPERWSHFSLSRSAVQPNGRLWDGSTIALY